MSSGDHAVNCALPLQNQDYQQQQQQYGSAGGSFANYGGKGIPAPSLAAAGSMSSFFGSIHAELGKMSAKELMDAKAVAALRNHSEAERRRRQRINSHLSMLRSLLPNTTKTDKASLLAEVIEHVKELKRQASTVAGDEKSILLPTEVDELTVDPACDATDQDSGEFLVRASLCCDDRPDLMLDLAKTLEALRMRARKAEITTLGGRVRNVLIISGEGHDAETAGTSGMQHRPCQDRLSSIQEALRGVLEKKTSSVDPSPSLSSGSGGSSKRQRMNIMQNHQASL